MPFQGYKCAYFKKCQRKAKTGKKKLDLTTQNMAVLNLNTLMNQA